MYSLNLSARNHWKTDDSKIEKFGLSKESSLQKNKHRNFDVTRVPHNATTTPTKLELSARKADKRFKTSKNYARLLSHLTKKYDQYTDNACFLSNITKKYKQYQTMSKASNDVNRKNPLAKNTSNSRSVVNYQKFTEEKELIQYQREELTCILEKCVKCNQGTKSLKTIEYLKIKRQSKNKRMDQYYDLVEVNDTSVEDETKKKSSARDTEGKKFDERKIDIIYPLKKEYKSNSSNENDFLSFNELELKRVHSEKKNLEPKVKEGNDTTTAEFKPKLYGERGQNELNVGKKKSLLNAKDKSVLNENDYVVSFTHKNAELKPSCADIKAGCEKIEYHSDCSYDRTPVSKQEPKMVLTHKYQNLVDILIENSSAGVKYCKNPPCPLFKKKMEEFAENVKKQYSTTGFIEKKNADDICMSKPDIDILSLDDKKFIEEIDVLKSKILESLMKRQDVSQYINDKSMFIAKHGDVLFYGSNINDIKGYGNW